MTQKIKKYVLFIFLTFLLVILLGLKLLNRSSVKVITSSPVPNQNQVLVYQKILIEFNQPLIDKDWTIVISPHIAHQYTTKDTLLEIVPKTDLAYSTKYQIELSNKNYRGFYFVLDFTTAPTFDPVTPTGTEKEISNFYRELDKQTYEAMPLFDFTPLQTDNYRIFYIAPLTLQVNLKKDTKQIRDKVLDWIDSKGIDPATHKIEWKLQQ